MEGALSCPCIRKPTMRVCVDEIETEFTELTLTLKTILQRSRVKCECDFCVGEAKRKEELKCELSTS